MGRLIPAAQRAAAPAARRLRRVAVRAVAEPLSRPANGAPGANGANGSSLPITSVVGAGSTALTFAPPQPPPPAINIPDPIPGVVPPAAVYGRVVDAGAAKAAMPWQKVLVMGALAGVFLGFGALLSLVVGGNCPGGWPELGRAGMARTGPGGAAEQQGEPAARRRFRAC